MRIESINPATGETLRYFDPLTRAEIELRLARAAAAFASYRRTDFATRAELLRTVERILAREGGDYARTITLEMGKPLRAAREEIQKCASVCSYYATHGEELLKPAETKTTASRSYVRFDPIGPVLAIMPWNFPFWQVFRFAAPALMAGNVCLLKHAANVPQCALALEQIFRQAGFGEGIFQSLLIDTKQTAAVIDDPRVKAVTLTGSERAGAEVASRAARQKEERSRARRERSVCRNAKRRSRGRQRGGREVAHHQCRTIVYRGEALHRSGGGLWALCRAVRSEDARAACR